MDELEFGNYYHIYNHGVGNRDLFHEPTNYEYFMSLYDKHIDPIAETFAWVLMKNHFHFLVRTKKKEDVIKNLNPDRVLNPVRVKNILSFQFSKLFNAYAQAFNKFTQSKGALFERPFKRKTISDIAYIKQLVIYIHNNPVHHGFCSHPLEYPWSSYLTCVSKSPTKLKREEVVKWFENDQIFETMHQKPNLAGIENLLFDDLIIKSTSKN